MSQAQTMNQLAELRLYGLLQAYQQTSDDRTWIEQSFDDRFAYLVNQEYERRMNNRIKNRVKEAGFKEKANLHELSFQSERNLSKKLIERLSTLQWLKNHENIIITGATGTGKSFLAQALGNHACHYFFKVKYYRVPELLNELYFGRETGLFPKIRTQLKNKDLLILDDWGLATLDLLAGHEIAEIIEDRLGAGSTIVVSQYPVHTWDKIFQDRTTADAIMDRLVSVAYTIDLRGPSLRGANASPELKEFQNNMVESEVEI